MKITISLAVDQFGNATVDTFERSEPAINGWVLIPIEVNIPDSWFHRKADPIMVNVPEHRHDTPTAKVRAVN